MISGNRYIKCEDGQGHESRPSTTKSAGEIPTDCRPRLKQFFLRTVLGETGESVPSFIHETISTLRALPPNVPPLYRSTLVSRSCGPVLYDLVESLNACV